MVEGLNKGPTWGYFLFVFPANVTATGAFLKQKKHELGLRFDFEFLQNITAPC